MREAGKNSNDITQITNPMTHHLMCEFGENGSIKEN